MALLKEIYGWMIIIAEVIATCRAINLMLKLLAMEDTRYSMLMFKKIIFWGAIAMILVLKMPLYV